MNDDPLTRRAFNKAGSLLVAGTLTAGGILKTLAASPQPERSKILGYHEKMGYRRLGKTDLWISEIGLGGHGSRGLENRKEVLRRAHELGVNYFDTNMVSECQQYGQALDELKLRDQFIIGFSSWPVEIAHHPESMNDKAKMLKDIDDRLKDYHTDYLDIWRPVGSTGGGDLTSVVTDATLDIIAETFAAARKAGKLRHLGLSSHHPATLKKIIGHKSGLYAMVLFPYFFMTKEKENGVLAACKEHDVGAIAIKPMAAGFVRGKAPVHLKKVLMSPNLTAAIPGMSDVKQLEENVQASYTRDVALSGQELGELAMQEAGFFDRLPGQYQWLRQWEHV
jgi:aryl-alcohol dehydrogenase-like predicted oxidoreductase